MSTTEYRLGTVSIRDEDEGPSLEGTAIVYGERSGETAEYGAAESFAPGAFRDAIANGRPVPFFTRHGGDLVGAVTFSDSDEALTYRGRLFGSPAAIAYREAVQAGIDGTSIEFVPGIVARTGDRVVHRRAKSLIGIAGSHVPAYQSSRVAVRGEPMAETIEAPETARRTDAETDVRIREVAIEVATELRRELAEQALTTRQMTEIDRALVGVRSLAELWHLVDTNRDLRTVYSRALADQITTNNPGVTTPGVIGTVKGIVEAGRPAISAFGRESLDGSGMTVGWPYFAGNLGELVGEQLTQKSEITSVRVDILAGSSPIKTYAGGSDISNQLLRRSQPSYLDAYSRIMLAAYAAVTEGTFVNAIEASATGAIALDWATATSEQIHAALANASVQVQDRTGNPASFGIAAAGVFITLLSKVLPVNAQNAIGSGTAAGTLAPTVSGLRIYYSPAVNANSLIVSNGQTAAWHEDGPFQVSEEDVAKLGRNVAVWGMGATAVYLPGAIIEIGAGTTMAAAERRAK